MHTWSFWLWNCSDAWPNFILSPPTCNSIFGSRTVKIPQLSNDRGFKIIHQKGVAARKIIRNTVMLSITNASRNRYHTLFTRRFLRSSDSFNGPMSVCFFWVVQVEDDVAEFRWRSPCIRDKAFTSSAFRLSMSATSWAKERKRTSAWARVVSSSIVMLSSLQY